MRMNERKRDTKEEGTGEVRNPKGREGQGEG